jgi:hypothetical protein
MIFSINFIELSLYMELEQFNQQLKNAYAKRSHIDKNTFLDESKSSQGIGVEFHTGNKAKIKFIINPTIMMEHNISSGLWNATEKNIKKFLKCLEEQIDTYFNYEFSLDDFKLSYIAFTVDMDFSDCDSDMASSYIRVFHNIGKVKGFKPISYGRNSGLEKANAFVLLGNSNGVAFMAYNKKAKLSHYDSEPAWDKLRLKHKRKMLRFDVVLTSQNAIKKHTDEVGVRKRILDLSRNREYTFLKTFMHIIPYGDFHKMPEAKRIVEKEIENRTLHWKMTRLLTLIPTKKSLLAAQKDLNDRNIEKIMMEFAKINLSPVVISRRQEIPELENLYKHFTG